MNAKKRLTLGSLFDGIGGFPYAGKFFGIKPLWASEIMPCAVSVTRRNLPEMAHVGDITKLHGGTLPPVDIITFGSPCQGLSHAGKRLGLADERSGLFSEAIRIIQEMREATNGVYPRYALWENVPGALSSGKPAGSDFQAVLEAFAEAQVPVPRSGKWANAGMVRSRGVDIAWCVYNAQYFGTAQRRRRIFLVADFAGKSAGEILFVPKSLSGYFAAGGTPRQGAAAYAAGRIDGAVEVLNDQGGNSLSVEKGGHSPTLRSQTHGNLPVVATEQAVYGICAYSSHSMKSKNQHSGIYKANTSRTLDTTGGSPACNQGGMAVVCLTPWDTQQARIATEGGVAPTLAGADGGGGRNPAGLLLTAGFIGSARAKAQGIGYEEECSPTLKGDGRFTVLCAATGQTGAEVMKDQAPTLTCRHEQPILYKAVGVHQNQSGDVNTADTGCTLNTVDKHGVAAVDCRNCKEADDLSGTLQAKDKSGYPLNDQNPMRTGYIVRRLTPTECERLQGYPDSWTALDEQGKPISDTKRYQMLGNSVAVPCVAYILQGMVQQSERRAA